MNPTPTNLPLVPHYGAYNNQYYANYNLSQQVATFPSAEESQTSTANHYENPSPSVESSHAEVATTTNEDIPADIIASQERALAAIRKQQPTAPRNSESSRALTVPFQSSYRSNPSGSVSIHPNRMDMKEQRKTKTAAGVVGGAVVGGLVFGPAFPVGMVLGGTVGGYASNKISKTGERRAQRKWEQNIFQRGAKESPVVLREGALV